MAQPAALSRQSTSPIGSPNSKRGVGAEYLERVVRIEQDVWRAELVAPADGQTLTYQIEADGQLGETYTLSGAAWRAGGGVEVKQLSPSRFDMCLTPSGDHDSSGWSDADRVG